MLKMLIGAAALTLCATGTANAQYMYIEGVKGDTKGDAAAVSPCSAGSGAVAAPGATPRGNLDRDIIRRTVPSHPRGGVYVATGDVNGDGTAISHQGSGAGAGKVSFPPAAASADCSASGKATGQIRTNQ